MKCAPPFSSSRLSNLFWSHISIPLRCARNFKVKLKSFCLVELLRIYLQLFSIAFLKQFVKKKFGHLPDLLLGLSSKVFTFDHLLTHPSDFFNNLPISLTEWPEYRNNKMPEL